MDFYKKSDPLIAEEAMPALGSNIIGIDHHGIAVLNMQESIEYYVELFSLVVSSREIHEEHGLEEAMLRLPTALPGTPALQLISSIREDSVISKYILRSGPGLHHLAFRVADIHTAMNQVRREGYKLTTESPLEASEGSRAVFVFPVKVQGVLLELVQR